MSLTAGEVINHARDMHAALSEVNAPAVLGFRHISRVQDDFLTDVLLVNPSYLGLVAVVSLPLADFSAGIDLAAELGQWADVLDVFARWSTGTEFTTRVWPVPWEQRDLVGRWPSWTSLNNTMFLMGQESAWSQIAEIRITYTAVATDVTEDGSLIVLRDDARDALATSLAAFYLRRLVGNPQFQVTKDAVSAMEEEATVMRAQWLRRVTLMSQRKSYQVRDVT